MKPKLLELYQSRQLQSFFKERMGKWQLWDYLFNFDGEFQAPLVHPNEVDELNNLEEGFPFRIDDVLRIPRTIDSINPERGLWGMLDWTKFSEYKMILNNGKLHLSFGNQEYIEDTPTEAILKALVVLETQW